MFQISVPVENPQRAAETLVALWGGMAVARRQADGNWAAFGAGRMVLLHARGESARGGIAQLPVATPHSAGAQRRTLSRADLRLNSR